MAHITSLGATGVGVDIAPRQIQRAFARYGHLPRITFTIADAIAFLLGRTGDFDVCYSVFGAVGLTTPTVLLPAIATALKPDGLLAFSVPHPSADAENTLVLPFGGRMPVQRWRLSTMEWHRALAASGLLVHETRHLPEPTPSARPTTLLITARKR